MMIHDLFSLIRLTHNMVILDIVYADIILINTKCIMLILSRKQ